jgi:hypothetical protein
MTIERDINAIVYSRCSFSGMRPGDYASILWRCGRNQSNRMDMSCDKKGSLNGYTAFPGDEALMAYGCQADSPSSDFGLATWN